MLVKKVRRDGFVPRTEWDIKEQTTMTDTSPPFDFLPYFCHTRYTTSQLFSVSSVLPPLGHLRAPSPVRRSVSGYSIISLAGGCMVTRL